MSASKAKGTAAESAVVAYLRDCGFTYAERRALRGNVDCGDIAGIPGVVIEVKNHARTCLGEWVDEAKLETLHAHAPMWAVWHKRRGKGSPGDWFVTMDGNMFAALIKDI